MKKDTVLVVRVPRELKEGLSRYEIEASEVIRKALEEEIRRKKLEELKETAARLADFLAKIPDEEIVKSIRETRKSR
jgi:post-segregation antitoxin (ccd killing protein)